MANLEKLQLLVLSVSSEYTSLKFLLLFSVRSKTLPSESSPENAARSLIVGRFTQPAPSWVLSSFLEHAQFCRQPFRSDRDREYTRRGNG